LVNQRNSEEIPDWQRQAWLTEYQNCQQHINSIGSQVWVSTTIFLTINVTLLGGLFYTLIAKVVLGNGSLIRANVIVIYLVLIGITVVGVGIIWILRKWINWLKRMRFRTGINFERMGEIEHMLGMRMHTMCRRFDLDYKDYKENKMSEDNKKDFVQKSKEFKYFPASGFDGLICIAKILIGVWSFSLLVLWAITFISLKKG
jgi:hypothetical protein